MARLSWAIALRLTVNSKSTWNVNIAKAIAVRTVGESVAGAGGPAKTLRASLASTATVAASSDSHFPWQGS